MIIHKVDDVDRITRLDDPIVRNLQITRCYYEISQSVARFDGHSANWCTCATWASKQAGQTIRTDNLLDGLVQAVNRLIRQVMTAHLMTLHLPGGEVLRLGRNLSTIFPQELAQIRNPKLREMLARADTTPDSLSESGAEDWANFEDRMHFITDFFRAYQERQLLFDAPFTPEQVAILKSGSKPSGRL